ncbi:hypothetical protein [Streptomyces sp. NPDC051214]|uniref:hypothetical protein n=1 Tax=Streptomyces sp. NPDC051214 TaxID=3155282 RepID=UPI0034259BF4
MASFDTGRLCAIVKILDQASTHLRLAAREHSLAGAAPGIASAHLTESGITALLSVSEQASGSVRRALVHIRNGEDQRAQHELDWARTQPPCVAALATPAGLPRPLPRRVSTALRLMQGITNFFPSETEQVLVRAALP